MSGQCTEDDVQYELHHRLLVTQASTAVPSWGGQEAILGWAKSDETCRGSDEDINTSAIIISSVDILGPITRSQAQQLNHQVNSFLCSSVYNIERRLLPNDLIILRNQGKDHGGQTKHQEGGESIQFGITEFESNSEFRTTSYLNWCPHCIWPPFWTFYICTKSKGYNLSIGTGLMSN
jgi:hypothetical protein